MVTSSLPPVRSSGAGPGGFMPSSVERESLFADFQPLVRRLVRQYGEDPELRQDLAGEIYCRFCALLDSYDSSRGIPLRAYLVRTLTASVYTYTRSQWRRQHREISLEATAGAVEPVNAVDPSGQWDHELMTQEVLKALPEAISHLPLRQRQVVIWRYYESRSFEEIAAMLHVRPATARSLLRHGLNNLRRQVARTELVWE
ncbi:MAG TPA: sigma-70 family RNA polymerase sigma factor [Armatimonadota bacterium]|nr:sigma-70 family RNA polymerase sigma factor [Armatimonadota bacterium]